MSTLRKVVRTLVVDLEREVNERNALGKGAHAEDVDICKESIGR
jgi:hypothetical protein